MRHVFLGCPGGFMRPIAFLLSLLLTIPVHAFAEEFAMKDGTKIVGHMVSVTPDTIEVETSYGKMSLKRSEILQINFSENKPASNTAATAADKAPAKIDDSLVGTVYTNRTAKFSLTLPADWTLKPELLSISGAVAGLGSSDELRYLMVTRETYTASLESYKGLVEVEARSKVDDFERVLDSHTTIDGQPSLLLSYRGTLPAANNIPVQFLVAIIPTGNTITRLTAWCAEPLFNETQAMFETILNSYHSTADASPHK
jgi:hypothetical protein